MEMMLHHQNMMLALRLELGWPSFKPANDSIGFCAGRPVDIEYGMELARIAQMLGKDLVHASWSSGTDREPSSFTVAYRMMFSVDVIKELVPFAANDDAPILLVSTRDDEFFAIDHRGSLARATGKPKNIGKGRRLAMKRIKATAATLGSEMLANRFVPTGASSIEPDVPADGVIVRFG